MHKAVFLDKDGTLIQNIPYNIDWKKIEFLPSVLEGLRLLQKAEYSLIVITNQSGIARGYFSLYEFEKYKNTFISLLKEENIYLCDFYTCPHFLENCICRKPKPGLLYNAAKKHSFDLPSSWLIGDILNDIEAGKRSGCRTILLDTGNETEWQIAPQRIPDFIAHTFVQAAEHILKANSYSYEYIR